MMKKLSVLVCLFASGMLQANFLNDLCVSFSTQGPDRYADGSTVLDGECYALVWSKDGAFDGINAKGECVDSNDRIVLVAPLAKDGRCPSVLFQVSEAEAKELEGGRYAVCLLDTRVASADGKMNPNGTVDGGLEVVNGYGVVTAALDLKRNMSRNAVKELSSLVPGQVADGVSVAPKDVPQPKIKDMRIDGDKVYLTVENLEGYMRVQGGKDVKVSDTTGAATKTTGGNEDVILVAPKSGSSGFYKVIRN
jgi:hypothetical protein